MEYTEIEIKSNVEDFCGKWAKADVQDELRECTGIELPGNEWVEYVIDHIIDLADREVGKIIESVACNSLIEDIKFQIPDNGWIRITKK